MIVEINDSVIGKENDIVTYLGMMRLNFHRPYRLLGPLHPCSLGEGGEGGFFDAALTNDVTLPSLPYVSTSIIPIYQ